MSRHDAMFARLCTLVPVTSLVLLVCHCGDDPAERSRIGLSCATHVFDDDVDGVIDLRETWYRDCYFCALLDL